MTDLEFLGVLHERGERIYDQVIALLWWIGRADPSTGASARSICDVLEATGLPAQNVSRLNRRLAEDRRVTKTGQNGEWRLHPRIRTQLNSTYEEFLAPRVARDTSSVLPTDLVRARGYLAKVVLQLNASYDAQLFDCCAVMCRRTLETLLIEAYEYSGRSEEIKGSDGNFLMLTGLISTLEKDKTLSISRNAMQGLREFKRLGDLSAHNRRYNARKEDIDRVRDGLRVAVEELAHLAGLNP